MTPPADFQMPCHINYGAAIKNNRQWNKIIKFNLLSTTQKQRAQLDLLYPTWYTNLHSVYPWWN